MWSLGSFLDRSFGAFDALNGSGGELGLESASTLQAVVDLVGGRRLADVVRLRNVLFWLGIVFVLLLFGESSYASHDTLLDIYSTRTLSSIASLEVHLS